MIIRPCRGLLLAAALLIALTVPVSAGRTGRPGLDVVLVMDSSGSMKKTDPGTLRIPAAKLFISLLGEQDRAGVESFSDRGYPVIYLSSLEGEKNRKRVLKATEKISSKGLYTNLYDALQKAFTVLKRAWVSDREKIVVLMSDGKMDVGDRAKDRELIEKMKRELIPALKKKKIKVYTIAFSEFSDRDLLKEIARATGGAFNLALSDSDLHMIFASIFESLKEPEMLPLEGNRFLVDRSVEEVTVVATKSSSGSRIYLQSPSGSRFSSEKSSENMQWFVSHEFVMVTIKKPSPGEWKLLFSAEGGNRVYIITDLQLRTNFDRKYLRAGEPVTIDSWLEKDGAVMKERLILEGVDLFAETAESGGGPVRMKLNDSGKDGDRQERDGIFSFYFEPRSPGRATLRIVARGKTFQREKSYTFDVIGEEKEERTVAEDEGTVEGVPEMRTARPAEDIDWAEVLTRFAIINAVLLTGVLLYAKRGILTSRFRKRGDGDEDENEDDDEEEEWHDDED